MLNQKHRHSPGSVSKRSVDTLMYGWFIAHDHFSEFINYSTENSTSFAS